MKMKSSVLMVSISLACLFAIFHSCHGIQCYSCQSRNSADKKCETISDEEYLHDYGDGIQNCMRVSMIKTEDGKKEERLLVRAGFSDESKENVDNMVKKHADHGYDVDLLTCKEDKCNSK